MEPENLKSFIKDNARLLREYFETKASLLKLKFIRLFSSLAGQLAWLLVCIFLFLLFVIFLALVAGFWLSDITGSYTLGFGLTSLGILIVLILFVAFGKKAMVNTVVKRIIAGSAMEINSNCEDTES